MIAIPTRHRSLTLLAGIVAAQVLLLAIQIKSASQVRLLRVWTVELLSPIQRASTWTIDGLKSGWYGYINLHRTKTENDQLHAELDKLKLRNAELEGRAAEAGRLAVLLNFREAHSQTPMLPARVIGASPDASSRMLNINRGSRDGLRRDMGVITPDGVIGKILAVYPDTSQVLLLNDKESGVGALLATTRTQGPVKGLGDPLLEMDYVSNDEKVSPGDRVLTSGLDHIFPKDLPVGTVVEATPDRKSPFMHILVQPAANLDRLEEVLVLLSRQEFTLTDQVAAPSAADKAAGKQP